ncbi:DMT family transporter [Gordonia sp. CPCC 206044]|uniref:DMT family transporter n=1 Tax=Gordonia sp. CPCC 206044 TaxID=3140793 RepID=UPI003AF405D5
MRIPVGPSTLFVVLWAFAYPLGALGVGAMSPMLLLTCRFAGSAVAMTALALATRRRFPRGRALTHVAVVGLLTQVTQFGGIYLGLQLGVPAVITALVIALNPVATAVLARPMLGERIGRRRLIGILIGVAAVSAACIPRIVADADAMGAAVALALVALIGVAAGGIHQQRFCADVDPIASNAVQFAIAAVPVAVIAVATPQSVPDPARAAWVVPTMIVLSSMVATTLFLRLVTAAGASATSMLFTLIPSVAALLGWALLGERPDLWIVLGIALAATSLVVAARKEVGGIRHERAMVVGKTVSSAISRSRISVSHDQRSDQPLMND